MVRSRGLPAALLAIAVGWGAAGAMPAAAFDGSEPPSLSGPIDLRPLSAPDPGRVRAAAPPKPRRMATPPLPRLRPTRDAAEVAVETVSPAADPETPVVEPAVFVAEPAASAAASAPVVRVVGPVIDPSVTGSISPAAVSANPPPQAELPPPPPEPATRAAQPVDDIPGDPMDGVASPPPAESAPPAFAEPPPLRRSLDEPRLANLPKEPYKLVRLLQRLQDDIAEGSTQALAAQRQLRERMDEIFLAADPSVWRDRRNAEAAVTYILSGGKPEVLKRRAEITPRPAVDMRLVTGALAYVEGREIAARENLSPFDVMKLPPGMAAPVALAQAALSVRNDPKKAIHLLDAARLLAPGTLVEEAALRREIFVVDQNGDVAKLETLVSLYLRRFRHSIYAGNFRIRLAAAISHLDFGSDAAEFHRLDEMLSVIKAPARCDLYLTVALAAVIKAKSATAALAADRALDLSAANSTEEARARLYRAAGLAVQPGSYDEAVETLKSVNQALLPASDRALYQVVATTIDIIGTGTDREKMKEHVASLDEKAESALPPSPVLARAGEAIGAVDSLLATQVR